MDESEIDAELSYNMPRPPLFPNVLYHYTTAEGLVGIVRSKALYATHLEYMNDMHELQYGKDVIVREVEKYNVTQDTFIETLFGCIKAHFSNWKVYDSLSAVDFFSVSFCEEGNILSQWRAYSASGGFSIGWDTGALQDAAEEMKGQLLKVVYDESEQNNMIADACLQIEKVVQKYKKELIQADNTNLPSVEENIPLKWREYFLSIFYRFALHFKRPEFREEREWRLVFNERLIPFGETNNEPCDAINFRERRGHISPFYEFDLKRAFDKAIDGDDLIAYPIREIVVGPSLDAEMNAKAVKALLGRMTARGHSYVDISKSNIPVRW